MIKVLDHGFINLEESAGTDLTIVNAAKVSFDKRAEQMGDDEEKILRFLIREKHTSPLEHTYMRFHVKAPKVVFAEWHRHRIGISINEISGRYVSFGSRDFYMPDHLRVQKGRPGNYYFEKVDDPELHAEYIHWLTSMKELFKTGYAIFEKAGVAKEQVRMPIPFNFYSEMIWTCNVHSLMHFLRLRLGKTAMFEIREYAKVLAQYFFQSFPKTWKFFKEYQLKDVMDEQEYKALP